MPINPLTGREEDEFTQLQNEYARKQKDLEASQSSYDTKGALAGALAAIGAGFQGRDSVGAAQGVMKARQEAEKDKVSALDKWKSSKLEEIKAKRDNQKFLRDEAQIAREDDVNSEESKMATDLAISMGYKGAPLTATRFKEFSPVMQKKYEIEQKKIENAINRDEKRALRDISLSDKKRKDAELSAVQAKQLGLSNIGELAEAQYNKATSDKSEYDPTGVGQWIDNSEWAPNWMKNSKAVESQAAQANWVEAYLRDASGAAIPPSERMAYAKDFFPQPGDTPDVVANKKMMRDQKMQNALLGAGEMGRQMLSQKQQPGKRILQTFYSKSRNQTKIIYDDGTEEVRSGMVAQNGR